MLKKSFILIVGIIFISTSFSSFSEAQRRTSKSSPSTKSEKNSSSTARAGSSSRARTALKISGSSTANTAVTTTSSSEDYNISDCRNPYVTCVDLLTNYFISKQKFMQEDPGIAEMVGTYNVFRCLYSNTAYENTNSKTSVSRTGLNQMSRKASAKAKSTIEDNELPKSSMLHKIYNYYCENPASKSDKNDIDRQNCLLDTEAEKNVRASGNSIAYLTKLIQKDADGTLGVQEINKDIIDLFGLDYAHDLEDSTVGFYLSVSPYNLYYDPNVYLAEANKICFMAGSSDSSDLREEALKAINQNQGLKSGLNSTQRTALIDTIVQLSERNCSGKEKVLSNFYQTGTWNTTLSSQEECEGLNGYWDDQVDGECKEILTDYLSEDICYSKNGDWVGYDENGNGGVCVRDSDTLLLSESSFETPDKNCNLYEATLKALRNKYRLEAGTRMVDATKKYKENYKNFYEELLEDANITIDEKIASINTDITLATNNFSMAKVALKAKYGSSITCVDLDDCKTSLETLRNSFIENEKSRLREESEDRTELAKTKIESERYEQKLKKYITLENADAVSFLTEISANIKNSCNANYDGCQFDGSDFWGLSESIEYAFIERDGVKVRLSEILGTTTVKNREQFKEQLKSELKNTMLINTIQTLSQKCSDQGLVFDTNTSLCYKECAVGRINIEEKDYPYGSYKSAGQAIEQRRRDVNQTLKEIGGNNKCFVGTNSYVKCSISQRYKKGVFKKNKKRIAGGSCNYACLGGNCSRQIETQDWTTEDESFNTLIPLYNSYFVDSNIKLENNSSYTYIKESDFSITNSNTLKKFLDKKLDQAVKKITTLKGVNIQKPDPIDTTK